MRTGPDPQTAVGGLPVESMRAGANFGQQSPRSAICHCIRILCALIAALIATGATAATDVSAAATQASAQARAVVEWGDPDFTAGDVYLGPGPAWWLGGGKFGGDWFAGGWRVPAETVGPADLLMFLDREALTNNLRFAAELALAPGSDLRLDLLDDQFQVLQADVLGNLADVLSARALALPLATQPRASVIRLRRFSGATLVGIC